MKNTILVIAANLTEPACWVALLIILELCRVSCKDILESLAISTVFWFLVLAGLAWVDGGC